MSFEELQADYLRIQFEQRDAIVSEGLSMIEALVTSEIQPRFLQKISSDVFNGIRSRISEHETKIRNALMSREQMTDAIRAYRDRASKTGEPEEGPF